MVWFLRGFHSCKSRLLRSGTILEVRGAACVPYQSPPKSSIARVAVRPLAALHKKVNKRSVLRKKSAAYFCA
eukprot:scaffold100531_cov56-Attheya_sp.AAC.5